MNRPRLTLIVARARNGVIGRDNAMPWKIPGEQAFFKRVTMGHPILMGRKTWESIGRPLPGRRSLVITRDRNFVAPGAEVVHGFEDALSRVSDADEAFVIGGAQIYATALPRADRVIVTEIDADFAGDTTFPALAPGEWQEVSREAMPGTATRGFAVDFVDYRRVR
jgi:dihydrofolate reductase